MPNLLRLGPEGTKQHRQNAQQKTKPAHGRIMVAGKSKTYSLAPKKKSGEAS